MSRKFAAATAVGLTLVGIMMQAEAQLSARPIAITPGREIAAFVDGAACAERVDLLFRGGKIDYFRSGEPVAARLMNNTINILQNQCTTLDRVTAQGYVDGAVVYSGIAEKGTNWRIIERGAGGGGIIGSGERDDLGGKATFAGQGSFVPAKTFITSLGAGQTLCEGFDPGTNTCLSTLKYEGLSDAGVTMVVRQYQDANGLTAILKYSAKFTGEGYHCADPRDSEVTMVGGDLSEASRGDFAEQLKARIEDVGSEACTGYLSADGKISVRTFDSNDKALPEQKPITILDETPGLRIES